MIPNGMQSNAMAEKREREHDSQEGMRPKERVDQ